MTERKAVVETNNFLGKERKYTFVLMNAENGLRLFHEYSELAGRLISPLLSLFKSGEMGNIEKAGFAIGAWGQVKEIISWEKMQEICEMLLAGSSVQIGDEIHEVGDSGVGEYTAGDPLEVYFAIYNALRANYPDIIAPLALLLSENESSSDGDGKTSDSDTNQQTKK
jgi:hypothetical protein